MEDVSFLDDKLPNEIINIITDYLEDDKKYDFDMWHDYYMFPYYKK